MADDSLNDENSGIVEGINETSEAIITQIQAEPVHLPFVPFNLVEKHSNKTTRLLANSKHDVSLDSRNRWHDYDFTKPIFIALGRVKTSGFSKHHEFRFKVELVDGGFKEYTSYFDDDNFAVAINEYVKSISFKPPSIWFSNPQLNEVMLWGFFKDELSEFLSHFYKIDQIKEKAILNIREKLAGLETSTAFLAAKEVELANVDSDISAKNQSLDAIESELSREMQKQSDLQSQNATITSQLQSLSHQVDEKKAEIGTLTTGREDIRLDIDRANSELKKLKENINLFPSEISGFVTQAGKDVKSYMIFSGVLITTICALSFWVIAGAFDLSEYVKLNPSVDVGKLLLAKIPSAIGVAAVVGACYKISRVFIEELLKINRQKLSLTQVSIIAKDVSFAAESGLNFDETELYGLRLRTKMALLADHIKTFVPSAPESLFPDSLFGLFGKTSRNENKDTAQNQPALQSLGTISANSNDETGVT